MRTNDETAIVPIERAIGEAVAPNEPTSIEIRCFRLSIAGADPRPFCCGQPAPIDLRAKVAIDAVVTLRWQDALPSLLDRAPSGVVAKLAADEMTGACAALDASVPSGGRLGDGCRIRSAARDRGVARDAWLLPDCALFPLDMVGGVLVPSARIPSDALVARDPRMTAPTLWELARAHAATHFGEPFAAAVDKADAALRAHATHGIHLKTLK